MARSSRFSARVLRRAACCALALWLAGCSDAPPSWDTLVAAKIGEQYPGYRVLPTGPGALLVERPGLASRPVDVNAIAQFCQRGPKDCNYALDQLLLELAPPSPSPPAPKS